MKFITIFEPNLYSVLLNDTNENGTHFDSEWDKLFNKWQDFNYIYNFFNDANNLKYFNQPYYKKKGLTKEMARNQVMKDVIQIRKQIVMICKKIRAGGVENLDHFFKPLNNNAYLKPMQLSKGKVRLLRIYAIRLSAEKYILTGGAIKLVEKMKDQNETYDELLKMNRVMQFLNDEGIVDGEGFYEMITE